MRPAFSIVIPVFKTEHFLEQCLRSVKSQTFENWECIVVNDGSPGSAPESWARGQAGDWSPQLALEGIPLSEQCRRIFDAVAGGDPRFHYIAQANQGLGPARNTGLDAATGERLVLLDSDDYLDRDYLQVAASAIAKHPDALVHGDLICLVDGQPKPFSVLGHVPQPNNLRTMLLFPAWTMTPINYFWKLDEIRAAGLRFVRRRGEDTLFALDNLLERARLGRPLEFVNAGCTYWYRRFGNQMSLGSTFPKELLASTSQYVGEHRDAFGRLGWRYRALAELFVLRNAVYLRRHDAPASQRIAYGVAAKGLSAVALAISGARGI